MWRKCLIFFVFDSERSFVEFCGNGLRFFGMIFVFFFVNPYEICVVACPVEKNGKYACIENDSRSGWKINYLRRVSIT